MADKTILELTDIGQLAGTEKIPVARTGVVADNCTTVGDILEYVKGGVDASQSSTYQLIAGTRDKTAICGTLTALTISLRHENNVTVPQNTVATVEFTSGSTATTLTYDSSEITFVGGEVPVIEANARYIISVWYDTAVCVFLNTVTNP